ncbi:MAG: DUF2273 domain-containing protein [Bacteroidota bacterium]
METESIVKALLEFLLERKGRIAGACLGLLVGMLWVTLGWWKAAIFLFCVILGYFIGLRVDRRDSWREILEKILPPTE